MTIANPKMKECSEREELLPKDQPTKNPTKKKNKNLTWVSEREEMPLPHPPPPTTAPPILSEEDKTPLLPPEDGAKELL